MQTQSEGLSFYFENVFNCICVDLLKIYLTNLMKWSRLRSQMNVIISPNSQQHAEMELEMLHM